MHAQVLKPWHRNDRESACSEVSCEGYKAESTGGEDRVRINDVLIHRDENRDVAEAEQAGRADW